MKTSINNIDDRNKCLKYLPIPVLQDIDKRISDWLASGGNTQDGYIKQQFRYAENFINLTGGIR